MDNEQKFYLTICLLIAIVVAVFILSLTATAWHTTSTVASAIERGVDPLAAKCALDMPQDSGKILCANLTPFN